MTPAIRLRIPSYMSDGAEGISSRFQLAMDKLNGGKETMRRFSLSCSLPFETPAIIMKTLLSLLLTLTATQAVPVTLHDTGFVDPPDRFGGPVTSQPVARWSSEDMWGADNFTVREPWSLNAIKLWTFDTTDANTGFFAALHYEIRRGGDFLTATTIAAGDPALQAIVLPDHRTGPDGNHTILTTFQVSGAVTLEPDTYWICIAGHSDPSGISNVPKWSRAATGDGIAWWDNGTGWTRQTGDGAFALMGEMVGIPDVGSTLLLFAIAFVPLLIFRGFGGPPSPHHP